MNAPNGFKAIREELLLHCPVAGKSTGFSRPARATDGVAPDAASWRQASVFLGARDIALRSMEGIVGDPGRAAVGASEPQRGAEQVEHLLSREQHG